MHSDAPRSCEGPRRFAPYGGACEWTGCPWLAREPRFTQWINAYNAFEGKLSYTEFLRAPVLLLDAFDTLDELMAQRRAYEDEVRQRAAQQRKG